jgi:D-glycero-D-manno-heptose 1,7-bisphosphate phosphatase
MRIILSDDKRSVGGPAIFIDRDGVINTRRANDYVLTWSEFAFIPGIREALRQLSALCLPMIMISNQSAVGRGLLTPAALEEITLRMNQTLLTDRISFAAAYFCPHRPDEHCLCRKPQPELLRRAAADFNLELTRSIFIGDSDTDMQAARAAGCQPVLFGPGLSSNSESLHWMSGLPVAPTASELFEVAAASLIAAGQATAAGRPLKIRIGAPLTEPQVDPSPRPRSS